MQASSDVSKRRVDQRVESFRAEDADGPFHHLIVTQTSGTIRDGRIYVASHWDGNLRAYGALVPGTVVLLTDDRSVSHQVTVPLTSNLRPLLLSGFTTRNLVKRSLAYLRARATIRRLIAQASFVQVQHVSAMGFLAGAAAVACGTPFYMDMGGSLQDPPGATERRPFHSRVARLYYGRVEKKLVTHARLLMAVSAHLHRTCPPTNAPQVVVTHSMIDSDDIYLRDDACTGEEIRLFVATRMVESKGIQDLIRAVKSLLDQGQTVSLHVAGVGEYQPTLKKLVRTLRLEEKIQFLGGIPAGPQLWAHYRQADLVVLPSRGHYEGTPRMIIEAWAAGAPVVATTVGGIPSMVNHEQDGLLVPPADVAALHAAITRIRTDSTLRRHLVDHGYTRVRDMTYECRLVKIREAFQQYLPGLLPEEVGCQDPR